MTERHAEHDERTGKTQPVYLIGAGPGDPDLLTVKAARLIAEADVVVYDRLVSTEIRRLIRPGATQIFAGKIARKHYMPQPEINALLVKLALAGHRVIRLKGGDPFLFGRGGEEAEHLAAHGIPFEIVPGITSASGCAAYAGIPLTHRGLAHSVRYVTGHSMNDAPLELDWAGLADPETTLVIYMGRTNARKIADELIAHGLPAETPAAAIVNGTRPDQQALTTTLAKLPEIIERLDLAAPTLLVIGRVVALAAGLKWFLPGGTLKDARRSEMGS